MDVSRLDSLRDPGNWAAHDRRGDFRRSHGYFGGALRAPALGNLRGVADQNLLRLHRDLGPSSYSLHRRLREHVSVERRGAPPWRGACGPVRFVNTSSGRPYDLRHLAIQASADSPVPSSASEPGSGVAPPLPG